MADASKAHPMTDADRRAFATELRRDEKNMEVTPEIHKVAAETAGKLLVVKVNTEEMPSLGQRYRITAITLPHERMDRLDGIFLNL